MIFMSTDQSRERRGSSLLLMRGSGVCSVVEVLAALVSVCEVAGVEIW